MTMAEKTEIAVIDEQKLKERIYTIRGQQVMLDFELAEIYGYTTKTFNQQVKNNASKFDEDFMFELTNDEWQNLRSKFTSSSWGGTRYLPKAFTEQGIYMLMTVLRGDLAVRQSKELIRLFKQMKDFIQNDGLMVAYREPYALIDMVCNHDRDIRIIKKNMVTKADLSGFIHLFNKDLKEEIVIMHAQPFTADRAYQSIYGKAKKSIIVIDDYIGVKTLHHLAYAKDGISIIIISDNAARPKLTQAEVDDWKREYPNKGISFLESKHLSHDRYIVLDNGMKGMKIYHCGASSKDAGNRDTTISEQGNKFLYKQMLDELLGNPLLVLP